VLRRVSGESPARPARAPGAVNEPIAGGLILVIWQPNHKGFSASHWQRGTCGAYDSLRLDCAKPLVGVQISIPGSDRVRPPWRIGVPRQFSRYSCTSASSCPRLKADLRPCRAFSLLLASRALCAAFAFKLVHTSVMTERLCEPQIDRVMNLSTEIGLAEMVRVIPDAQTDAALRIWPTTTSKLRLETGWEKCPHGPHGPKHATELLIRTW
jgi:hypothetical protein